MNDRNLLKGLLLALIALVFGVGALHYSVGHVERAGPGFFPLMVSSILFVLGAAMVVRSRFTERAAIRFNWKNIAIIMGSLAGFAVLSAYVNMISGIVFLVFASAFAGTSYSVRRNAMVAAVLVGVAFAFQKGLGLQLPLY
ncbi:MAG TPA: tripartite tricarboxylate transporter TctB family protein [Usitatibacter sp.]|nr:tripartite tricarboxylate transporter TctB family protein [Usitatibacter sp.]